MSCPICDNKPANCDCSSTAIRLHEENEELKAELEDAVQEERERCAKLAQNWKVIGGETPGPMWEAGWNEACAKIAASIRASQT